MSDGCGNHCSTCGEDCAERGEPDFRVAPHELSEIKNVIGVVSGKGGVGKSLVTSLLASAMRRNGFSTAILDADVTGPSIPRAFGLTERAMTDEQGVFPVKTAGGISVMSVNLLLEKDTEPVIWRGPVIAGAVQQFWKDVIWDKVDYMFVDMPPGTGDVPLTVFQSLPVTGIVVVASPQQLVGMIVEKAVNMAAMMNIPVLALVENMATFKCPDCGGEHRLFGDSHVDEIVARFKIDTVARLPVDPRLAAAADQGTIERQEEHALDPVVDKLLTLSK